MKNITVYLSRIINITNGDICLGLCVWLSIPKFGLCLSIALCFYDSSHSQTVFPTAYLVNPSIGLAYSGTIKLTYLCLCLTMIISLFSLNTGLCLAKSFCLINKSLCLCYFKSNYLYSCLCLRKSTAGSLNIGLGLGSTTITSNICLCLSICNLNTARY